MRGRKISTKRRIRVAVLFGGRSAEHEVSILSAKNVINALDQKKYDVIPVAITKTGGWFLGSDRPYLPTTGYASEPSKDVALTLRATGLTKRMSASEAWRHMAEKRVDVVFPVLHGPYGEDGSLQGFLKLAGIPFVGAGVLGSAIGMDKDVTKRLLREAGILVAKFIALQREDKPDFKKITRQLGVPVFIKPANLGSSVGVSKVSSEKKLHPALKKAFRYDTKVLVEQAIEGREIECSVLGGRNPTASVPGEVIPQHEFYSYEAKYLDENGALLEIPAKLPPSAIKKIQATAVRAFKIVNCEGMGRVDFFLKENGDIVVNEINTIPGFTKISMYPKLWEASGISYSLLLDRLIRLALQRFAREQKLRHSI